MTDEVLIAWGQRKRDSEDETSQQFYKLMEKFLEWLEESEEEDDDDSDESEEDN